MLGCQAVAARRLSPSLWALLFLSAFFTGCGSGEPPPPANGSVSGKVMYNGAAPKNAAISFTDLKSGIGGSANIADDGSYSIVSIPAVEYVITITARPAEVVIPVQKPGDPPADVAAPPAGPAPVTNVPAKYAATSTSGLKAKVEKGVNTFNFDLKD